MPCETPRVCRRAPLAKFLDVQGIRADEYDAVGDFECFSRDAAIARTRRSGIIGDGPENHRLARSGGAFEEGETVGNGPRRGLVIENEGRAAGNMVHGISRKVGLGRGDGLGARPQGISSVCRECSSLGTSCFNLKPCEPRVKPAIRQNRVREAHRPDRCRTHSPNRGARSARRDSSYGFPR